MIVAWPACLPAAQLPLWELGLGVGVVGFPDYRGSDTTRVYPVPVPYLVYRGDFLKSDREGLRGILLNQRVFEINLSANATTPVSGSDRARYGMPDLRPTVELGPSFDTHLWQSANARVKFDLRLPVRAAVTVASPPSSVGWFFAPHFAVDFLDLANLPGWNVGLLMGPLFANHHYDNYYYGVAPPYASAQRPAYDAPGGYAGTEFLASTSRRFTNYWVGAYLRYDTLSGAAFAGSPLVRRDSYWSAGVGIAWMIHTSSRLVEADE
jgi:outer membrane scaffolding protein for murein synthesis (MipA/OmpV family)